MKHQTCAFSILLFTLLYSNSFSQAQLGIRNDNYAGINSVLLNPAGYINTPFDWDVNLVEGSIFAENNYAYFVNSSLLSLLSNDEDYVYGPDNRKRDIPVQGLILDYYEDNAERYAFMNASILGPSFYARFSPNIAGGFLIRMRSAGSVTGIPDDLSFYKFNELLAEESFTMQEAKANLLSWREIGLNLLHQKETASGTLGIGVNLKFLQGYEGAYVFNETPLELSNLPFDSIQSGPGSVEFAYTTTSIDGDDFRLSKNGRGVGIDLGFTYAFGQADDDVYQWKLGVSVLDIGKINFDQNARFHKISTDTSAIFGGSEYRAYDNIHETEAALQHFSFQVLGDSLASLQGSQFSMWLPAAVSFQFDYYIANSFFVNATVVQGVPLAKTAVSRANLIGITPRYETRWIGVAAPVSFYNFDQLRFGLAARLGPLHLGTDNLMSILGRSDFSGTDFYMGLKLNPFGKNIRLGNGQRGNGGGGPRCYEF